MIFLKRILTCFALLITLASMQTVAAKPAEITSIDAFDIDSDTVRIEISYCGGRLYSDNVSIDLKSGVLRVELDNTLPGRISRLSGTQIQDGARDFVDKIIANETQAKHTTIQFHLKTAVNPDDVNISLEPATRSDKKADRVILDIKKYPLQSDEWFPDDTYNYYQKIIVLDPGHGGSDAGAIGPTGITEKSVALAVSLKARELLSASGYKVIMTRSTDIDVAAPGVSDATELQARVNKAPANADIFISIHCNAFSNASANGMETYHAPNAVKGSRLASLLNDELAKLGNLNNRGVKLARFYVLTHANCPASLIELGFISNPREEFLLASDPYQQKLAQAIANAVFRYFSQGGSN